MRISSLLLFLFFSLNAFSQQVCSQEFLWSLGRVNVQRFDANSNLIYYSVSKTDMNKNKNNNESFYLNVSTEEKKINNSVEIQPKAKGEYNSVILSPNGKKAIVLRNVLIDKVKGKDRYPNFTESEVYVYDQLNYRHWDTWEDGAYEHPFIGDVVNNEVVNEKDMLSGLAFDCPTKPFGGEEDVIFTPDSRGVVYVTKKLAGNNYALSTNTDIYLYEISSGIVVNLSKKNEGYDMHPVFSPDGNYLAWTQMQTDGFESDKNDIVVMDWNTKMLHNCTQDWDGTVNDFMWDENSKKIFFTAPHKGTEQLFICGIEGPGVAEKITQGVWNIASIIGQKENTLFVTRTDMNHAAEIFSVNLNDGNMKQLSHENDEAYKKISLPEVKERYTKLKNGEEVFSWVIYPPNFDPSRKYPTLLYCQGGPQSALSQFYSFRWNLQLMASKGYIVICPNRTGMPGWGTKWNADISGDWGGNPMRDYLAAIDDISKEDYVNTEKLGAVGASYGGYSVFMLAGIHKNRFKTFISHCGLFDLKSWYGTTEELFFANYDIGGNYWDTKNKEAQNSYREFSPSNFVENWNTPILIFQGGKDFRVPIEQGQQAFQAAQLKGIKSRFVYLPNENHWVLKPQNAMVWQNEFFNWLEETLK